MPDTTATLDEVFLETVSQRFGDHIIASTISPANDMDRLLHQENFQRTGECDHRFVRDEPGWLYDIRTCATCGIGLGTV